MQTKKTTHTYLVRYWIPGKRQDMKSITVQSTEGTDIVLQKEKAKVKDADSYSWCCDWLTQGLGE